MVKEVEPDEKDTRPSSKKEAVAALKPPLFIRRLNGFDCPPHAFQIVAVLANIWTAFFFYGLHVLALYGWLQYLFIAVFSAAVLVHGIFLLVATAIDPADPNVRAKSKNTILPVFDRSKHKHVIENLTCAICEVKVGLKSKHCSACNKCVWNFDHHCPWLNNCVGGANYRFFITTVVAADIGLLLLFGLSIAQLVTYFSDVDNGLFLRPYYDRLNFRVETPALETTTLRSVIGSTSSIGGTNTSSQATTELPPANFLLVGASVPTYVWLIFVCIDILLAAVGIGLLTHLLVFHCYLASHHLSTYDYITLQQQPAAIVDDGVSVADEGRPCSGRGGDFSNEGNNGYPTVNSNNNARQQSYPNNYDENNYPKRQKTQKASNLGCSALGSNQRRSRVDVVKSPGDNDSISTVSARVLTDSGRYTGVDYTGNALNSYRGGVHLAPLNNNQYVGQPLSSRSPRHRRRRSRANKNLAAESQAADGTGLEGAPYDSDYHQQMAEMRATFPPVHSHFPAGLTRDGNDDSTSPPIGVSPLPLPPPSPTPLASAAATTYNASSSVWRTTDRSTTFETDTRMFGETTNKLGLPPLGISKLQLPLSSTTSYAIGTNPLLGASFESNFSQYSLRSAAPYHEGGNLFASKFGNNNNNNGNLLPGPALRQSGFPQPQLMVAGVEQLQSDYLIPRLSLSHSSFAT